MARRRSFSTLALAALLGAAACGDIDAGRNNEDTGPELNDLTPGDTRDAGTGTTYSVSADTATPKISDGEATGGDSARAVAATATGSQGLQSDSVGQGTTAPGSGPAAAASQQPAQPATPQPPVQR